MIPKLRSRRFSHPKFLLLLLFVLNFDYREKSSLYRKYLDRDVRFCPACFQQQSQGCTAFFELLEYDKEFPIQNLFNLIVPASLSERETYYLRLKNNHTKIVAKNFASNEKLKGWSIELSAARLSKSFSDEERLDRLQYCPMKTIPQFVDFLSGSGRKATLMTWLYLLVNVQPMLMPLLYVAEFPVPKSLATCGFTLFQEYTGNTLGHYYSSSIDVKLKIAKQLLEAALRFSHGLHGYRIYITDMNPDNIVFNEADEKLYFIDLDTVLIVDSAAITTRASDVHKHVYIECDDCFAYSQEDICAHQLSDINLFAACQLLREDLKKDRTKGFLYPLPAEITGTYPNLLNLLDVCVDCVGVECDNRFAATLSLIELFKSILENIQ